MLQASNGFILLSIINADGTISRYKARLISQGFTQQEGIDFSNTFSLVAKLTTVKLLLALAAVFGWNLAQMDVSNAFFHSELDEAIYMSPFGLHTSSWHRLTTKSCLPFEEINLWF